MDTKMQNPGDGRGFAENMVVSGDESRVRTSGSMRSQKVTLAGMWLPHKNSHRRPCWDTQGTHKTAAGSDLTKPNIASCEPGQLLGKTRVAGHGVGPEIATEGADLLLAKTCVWRCPVLRNIEIVTPAFAPPVAWPWVRNSQKKPICRWCGNLSKPVIPGRGDRPSGSQFAPKFAEILRARCAQCRPSCHRGFHEIPHARKWKPRSCRA